MATTQRKTNPPFVLLVHGLHMNGLYMRPLAKKLAQAGFDSHAPSYHSLTQSIDKHSQRLHTWLSHHHDPTKPIHLVGHSLGGLVMRHFLAQYGNYWQIGRCVTLGTPHMGSICANYANRLLPPLVHKAYPNALDGVCVPPPNGVPFGVIAGTRSFGLGLPLLTYHNHRHHLDPTARTNDGTVYLSETTLPQASDYLVLPVSHTQLILDRHVANEVIHFLKYGKFSQTKN
ncbi:esterase/lipase family protein [Moraxella oblonga]|uniref:esterase/lipase family protein n=1 Tax=Moraxella oblonga TaxID=200413 RepID=UPI000AE55A10|nr:alpha/beta fold hydrolase [Moraxella oblonga]